MEYQSIILKDLEDFIVGGIRKDEIPMNEFGYFITLLQQVEMSHHNQVWNTELRLKNFNIEKRVNLP